MSVILLILTNASLFSVDGLGRDRSVFQKPYLYIGRHARIEFTVRPEWTLLYSGQEVRSVFWSNPFHFFITAPVYRGLAVGAGNRERFNQNFDVFLENEELRLHVNSRGGIEEAFGTVGYRTGFGELVIQGSYLFGNTMETWDYLIQNYNLIDTLRYQYTGSVFCAGVYTRYVSCYFEPYGTVDMTKPSADTTVTLPRRLGIGLHAKLLGGRFSGGYEYSWWDEEYDYNDVHRFQLQYDRETYGIGYTFNPWYLERVTEHGIDFSYKVPLPKLGMMRLHLACSLRETENVQEFMIAPLIELSIRELFVPRRK